MSTSALIHPSEPVFTPQLDAPMSRKSTITSAFTAQPSLPCTLDMCIEVCTILPPRQQALMRVVVANVFEMMIEQGKAHLYLIFNNIESDEPQQYAPISLPASVPNVVDIESAVVVVDSAYLNNKGILAAALPIEPFQRVRFVITPGLSYHMWTGNGFKLRVKSIEIRGGNQMLKIPDGFLVWYDAVTCIDFRELCNVTEVGSSFLTCCTSLATINLSPLSNVTTIGTSFCFRCSSLSAIDLSPLSNVTTLESMFLAHCISLKSVDLSPLSNVTYIGSYFMTDCQSLGTIKLAPLNNATTVGNGFLADSLFVIEDEKDLSANVRRALPNSKDTCCVVM